MSMGWRRAWRYPMSCGCSSRSLACMRSPARASSRHQSLAPHFVGRPMHLHGQRSVQKPPNLNERVLCTRRW